jgi:hypothetical protein
MLYSVFRCTSTVEFTLVRRERSLLLHLFRRPSSLRILALLFRLRL